MKSSFTLALIALLTSSCVTVWRFRETEDRVAALEKRLSDLEEDRKRDLEKLERLHRDLLEATETLRLATANQGADLEQLRGDIAKLRGDEEEIQYRLSRLNDDVELIKKGLEEKLGLVIVKVPQTAGSDPESWFKAGLEALNRGDNKTARGLFQQIIDRHPDHPKAPEAQYLMGESYFRDGMLPQAIREFQRVHDRYRNVKGAPVEKALLRISECLVKRGECGKAQDVLRYLIDYNGKSAEAKEAKERLKALKKECK